MDQHSQRLYCPVALRLPADSQQVHNLAYRWMQPTVRRMISRLQQRETAAEGPVWLRISNKEEALHADKTTSLSPLLSFKKFEDLLIMPGQYIFRILCSFAQITAKVMIAQSVKVWFTQERN